MNSESIIAVSAAVVACVQLAKWSGIPDRLGPLAVLFLSFVGVAFWGWSAGTFERAVAFDYFAGWITVATSAAGIFGFTRASATAVSNMSAPPTTGAGSSPTVKETPNA